MTFRNNTGIPHVDAIDYSDPAPAVRFVQALIPSAPQGEPVLHRFHTETWSWQGGNAWLDTGSIPAQWVVSVQTGSDAPSIVEVQVDPRTLA